jgi:AcrR family transcriptional regulator
MARLKTRHTPSDTRERIVEAARFLFWQKGYTATGLAELLARAGANSGSFYHFFESKDAVLRAVLDTYVELLAADKAGDRERVIQGTSQAALNWLRTLLLG